MATGRKTAKDLRIEELELRLAEAEDTLRAIREGEVDAVIVSGSRGEQVFSLVGTDSIYRLIVETMKEAAFTVTFEGRILFCNAQFGEFVKRPLEQIVGHLLREFVAEDDHGVVASFLVAAERQPTKQRLVFRAPDGATVPVHLSSNVLHQPDGLSICVVASDLRELENSTELIHQLRRQQEALQAANEELAATEEELRVQNEELAASRAELDRTRARYQNLFETAPDGYLVTDPEGILQEANQAAARLLGCPAGQLKGNPFSALLPPDQRDGYIRLLQSLSAGRVGQPKWEVEIRPLAGPRFWAAVTAAASCDDEGRVVGLRWLLSDITARRQAEDSALRQAAILKSVNDVLHAALTSPTERDLGATCLRIAVELTQSPFGFIGEVNDRGLEDIAISNPGWTACLVADAQGHRVPPGGLPIRGIYGRVISDGKSLFTNDPAHHPDRVGLPKDHPPLTSFLGVPMKHEGRTIGMIAVANRPGGYSAAEQEELESLAPAIVQAFGRKRAEEAMLRSEKKYRSLFENSLDAIFLTHPDGRVTDVNPAACRMFGRSKEEICQLGWDAIPAKDARDGNPGVEGRAETEKVARERTFLRADGSEVHTETSSVIIPDDAGPRSYVILRDISLRKKAENQMREAAQELARSNEDLRQFAYIASHDLQEPLRMVSGFLNLLREKYTGQLDAKAQEYIGFSVDGAHRMSALIKDLLEYSKVAAAGKQTTPTDLAAVVDYVKANLRTTIEEANAEIAGEALPTVMADTGQMRQLLQNLIGNALKFRPEGRRPEVRVSASREGGEWVIRVKDNGIGIAPEQKDRIFVIFQRLHGRDKYEGTGIGLAICKKIVERHGGRIWVESEPGKGSTFCFSLPGDRP